MKKGNEQIYDQTLLRPKISEETRPETYYVNSNGEPIIHNRVEHNCDKLKIAIEALEKSLAQIDRHRTWTGMAWKQNPLADFVAVKINRIIYEALLKIKEGK